MGHDKIKQTAHRRKLNKLNPLFGTLVGVGMGGKKMLFSLVWIHKETGRKEKKRIKYGYRTHKKLSSHK